MKIKYIIFLGIFITCKSWKKYRNEVFTENTEIFLSQPLGTDLDDTTSRCQAITLTNEGLAFSYPVNCYDTFINKNPIQDHTYYIGTYEITNKNNLEITLNGQDDDISIKEVYKGWYSDSCLTLTRYRYFSFQRNGNFFDSISYNFCKSQYLK